MTEFEGNDMNEIKDRRSIKFNGDGTERICAPCHINNLNEHILVFERKFFFRGGFKLISAWRCPECGRVDFWDEEDQKWSRDYEYLQEELEEMYGEE
jgi:hypothetical protein